jgi:hypothetical protein
MTYTEKELISITGKLYHRGFRFWLIIPKEKQYLLNKIPEIIADKTTILILDDNTNYDQIQSLLSIRINSLIITPFIEELI